jgi:hypothetical protein
MRSSPHPRVLVLTLRFIAMVQFVLGAGFLLAPEGMASVLGLAQTPGWANWMFGMMAVRFLAFGYGMLRAARDPGYNLLWIQAMVGIQLVDWSVTVKYLLTGAVTLAQVSPHRSCHLSLSHCYGGAGHGHCREREVVFNTGGC